MKFAILPLLALALNGCHVDLSEKNLISNGQFNQNSCAQSWCLYNQDNYHNQVSGWLPAPELQIGQGDVYSTYLTNQRVLQLDGNQNTCAKQVIQKVVPGSYKISVGYLARNGTPLDDNQFKIQFNGQVLKTITPTDYAVNTENVQITVNSELKDVELKLCGTGTSNGYGTLIKQVKMERFYPNLIKNSDLKLNSCTKDWCLYKNDNYQQQVQDWTPENQLQIGYGRLYSNHLQNQRVFQLDGDRNTCIKQVIPTLSKGLYQFQVGYGARKGVSLQNDNQFHIQFNGKTMKKVTPTNYELHKQSLEISVQSELQNVQLKLCGQGTSNGLGAFVYSTKLIKVDQAVPFRIEPAALTQIQNMNRQHFLRHQQANVQSNLRYTQPVQTVVHEDSNKVNQMLRNIQNNRN